jgi:ATP-binding cassette, subfamily B, bacterial CvaB/MchF/RaxB
MPTIPPIFGRTKLPVILQSEAAECALACLAMLLNYYGHRSDLASLRSRFQVSLRGANLYQLLSFAEHLKLVGRPLRLDPHELRQLKLPCILHWRMNHFVVLAKASDKHVLIHDPAVGTRKLDYLEIGEAFTGIALELSPRIDFQPVDELKKVSIRRLLGKVNGLRRGLFSIFIMALALEALGLAGPMMQQWTTDEALASGDRELLDVLAFAGLMLMFTQAALSQARSWCLMYLSTHFGMQWSSAILAHLLNLPLSWFEKRDLGDVVSRFNSAGAIKNKVTTGFLSATLDGIMAIGSLSIMLVYSPLLTCIVLTSLGLYGLLRVLSYRALREACAEGMILNAQEQSCFFETIRAVQAVKLSGRELDRRMRWLNLVAESINRSIKTQKLGLTYGNALLIVNGIISAMLFRIGAGMIIGGGGVFTIGMLFAFISYSGQFCARAANLIDNAIEWRMLSVHCERLADIVLEKIEPEVGDFPALEVMPATLEFANVSFRYSDVEPWVLRNVSFSVGPGELVAVVGPSGSGKSTLIKLILGTLQPTDGEIRYGGSPILQIGVRNYRKVLGAVMQNDQLLSGSILDNIAFFDPTPDHKRIERCAKLAAIDGDILNMPMGYNSLVGDMGSTLSGGQKQRVLLAPALYKSPKLLVLDEATSHLDVATERVVNDAVSTLGCTRIIVAHRPDTIATAQRVIRLIDGVVVADEPCLGTA